MSMSSPTPPDTRVTRFLSVVLSPRFVAVAIAFSIGLVFTWWDRGIELGHVLRYLALVAVSLFASQWMVILGLNVIVGGAWWAFVFFEIERLPRLRRFVMGVSRQLGHVEALFALTIVPLVWVDKLWIRLPLATVIAVYGASALGWLAHQNMKRAKEKDPQRELNFNLTRRPYFYLATGIGWVLLVVMNPTQIDVLVGLGLALGLGIAIRLWATHLTVKAYERDRQERVPWLLRPQRTYAIPVDRAVAIVLVVLVGGWVWQAEDERARDMGREMLRRLATVDDCRLRGAAGKADVSLFIVSDSQFHELRGERSGVQMDLVDKVVPVAQRPVELDLLSGATLGRFSDLYQSLRKERPEMLWAHLGDIGDVACDTEIQRFGAYVKRFGAGTLAGVAPGNHDSTFFGNFVWHPDWKAACAPGTPLHKEAANIALLAATKGAFAAAAHPADPPIVHRVSRVLRGHKTALPTVTKLGAMADGREIYGVFLDSADYTGLGLGIAGVQGAISGAQADWLTNELRAHEDQYLIVFSHHPFAEMSFFSRRRLKEIVAPFEDRLLAMVSAHTHLAARRLIHLGDHKDLTEIIVGSVVDAPQEAALLEVYARQGDRPAVVVRTVPSVSLEGRTCGFPKEVEASECAAMIGSLREQPSCEPLFASPNFELPSAASPDDVRKAQETRALALKACVCRDKPGPSICASIEQQDDALDASFFDGVYATAGDRKKELVCLSWASSILQSHKHQGWSFNRALAYGFDGGAALRPMVADTWPDEPAARGK